MNDLGSDEEIAEIKRRRSDGYREHPIVVIAVDDVPDRYAIVFGNHRALLASWEQESLDALVIETPEDFAAVEQQSPIGWTQSHGTDDTLRYATARAAILEAAMRIGSRERP
jgi:hypothetical protein